MFDQAFSHRNHSEYLKHQYGEDGMAGGENCRIDLARRVVPVVIARNV